MRGEPQKRISEKALKVWRLYGIMYASIMWIISIAALVLTILFDWHWGIVVGLFIVAIAVTYIFVSILPKLRWRRWRYEVREQEIELQRGIIIVKRTLVPMVRVQHVDTGQGPILKKYNLSTITISTAATKHEIPALETSEADELRTSISLLARVAEDDV
jgi:uncharacterized protein